MEVIWSRYSREGFRSDVYIYRCSVIINESILFNCLNLQYNLSENKQELRI